MLQRSVIRRTKPTDTPKVLHCVDREYVVDALGRFPGSVVAITRDVTTGQIVGVEIGREKTGVMVMDPHEAERDRPVSWHDVDGVPHWRRSGLATTGSYRSEIVTADQLLSLLS